MGEIWNIIGDILFGCHANSKQSPNESNTNEHDYNSMYGEMMKVPSSFVSNLTQWIPI